MNARPLTSSLRRTRTSTVAPVLGLVLALVWFVAVRVRAQRSVEAERDVRVDRGVQLVTLLRQLAQDRVQTGAQVLSQDPRLQAVAGLAEPDRATIDDLLQDLQQLDPQELFTLLDAKGRVLAARGAPQLEGLDLSSSAVVKAALTQDRAVTGVWLVNERVVELAVSAIRVGDRRVGLLGVGVKLEDAALETAASAAKVDLALLLEGRPAWVSSPGDPARWLGGGLGVVPVTDAARYVVAAQSPPEDATARWAWVVPIGALVFAFLGFWRGGHP